MKLKSNATSVDGLHPALIPHLFRLDDWCRDHLGYELIITSCTDGVYGATSRHYLGTAIDVRTWTAPTSGVQIEEPRRTGLVTGLRSFLGPLVLVRCGDGHREVIYSCSQSVPSDICP